MLYLGKDGKGELSSPEEKEVTIYYFFSGVDFPILVKHMHIPVQGLPGRTFVPEAALNLQYPVW